MAKSTMQVSNWCSLRPVDTGNIFLATNCFAILQSIFVYFQVSQCFPSLLQRIAASYETVVIHKRTLLNLPCSICVRRVAGKMLPLSVRLKSFFFFECNHMLCRGTMPNQIERALDSGSRNSGFKLDQNHCAVFLGGVLLGCCRVGWGKLW